MKTNKQTGYNWVRVGMYPVMKVNSLYYINLIFKNKLGTCFQPDTHPFLTKKGARHARAL